jgi:thioredoxin
MTVRFAVLNIPIVILGIIVPRLFTHFFSSYSKSDVVDLIICQCTTIWLSVCFAHIKHPLSLIPIIELKEGHNNMKMTEITDEIMKKMITKQVIKENPELTNGLGCLGFLAFVFLVIAIVFFNKIALSIAIILSGLSLMILWTFKQKIKRKLEEYELFKTRGEEQ